MSAANVESQKIPPCSLTVPLEIVGEILRHMNTVDLLNCRLVSKVWNKECLATLKKRTAKPRVKLDNSNIQSFMAFVASDSNLLSFPWKFELDVWTNQFSQDKLKIFAAQVMFILSLYGPECVDKLILPASFIGPEEADGEVPELVFFSKLAAGLTQVHIRGGYFEGVPDSKTMRFPKLKSFKFGGLSGYVDDFDDSLNAVKYFCYENMASLEELILPVDEADSYVELSLKKLSSLEIVNMYYLSTLLDKIRLSPSPPIIRKLSFGTHKDEEDVEILTKILAAVANTLQSLKLIDSGDYDDDGTESAMIPLPHLPHLQKFRIDLRTTYDSDMDIPERATSVDLSKYNFNPEALPALEKIDLPTGYRITQWRPEFPNVWRATVRISEDPRRIFPALETVVYRLQSLFPNLSKVTVVNETLEKSEAMKDFLLRIMASSKSSTLQELVIRNGDDDLNSVNFLGEILTKKNFPTRLTLENVEYRTATDGFQYAARDFLRNWTGLGETGVKLSVARGLEQNMVTVAVTIQNNPGAFDGTKNVMKIRLEQYSSIRNEERRKTRRAVTGYAFPKPLNPSQQQQQLLNPTQPPRVVTS